MEITLTLKAEFQDHLDPVRNIQVHPRGGVFFTRSNEMLILYSLPECRKLRGFYGSGGYDAAGFSGDGQWLLYMIEGKVHHWDIGSWRDRMVFTGELAEARDTDVHPGLGLLADGGQQGHIALRKLGADEADPPEFVLEGHESYIEVVRFHPSGKLLASGSADMTIRFWDVGKRALISPQKVHGDFVTALGFSPDGSVMISGDYSGKVKVWGFGTS